MRVSLSPPDHLAPGFSASAHIERNFKIVNCLPLSPTLVCLKRTGSGDVALITIAMIVMGNARITIASSDKMISKVRFMKSYTGFRFRFDGKLTL